MKKGALEAFKEVNEELEYVRALHEDGESLLVRGPFDDILEKPQEALEDSSAEGSIFQHFHSAFLHLEKRCVELLEALKVLGG